MVKNHIDIRKTVGLEVMVPYSIFSEHRTYATLFLNPAFGLIIPSEIKNLWWKHYVNSYIGDYELRQCFKRPLFVLLRYEDVKDIATLENFIKSKREYVYSYPVGIDREDSYRMYVLECPDAYKNEYDVFLKSKYSRFSDKYKLKFANLVPDKQGVMTESQLYGAIHRTAKFRRWVEDKIGQRLPKDQELFPAIKDEYEVFRFPS